MIDPTQQMLLDGSLALGRASSQARAWITRLAQSATSVASEEHSLLEETRRAENLARKVAVSAGRRNSAGVFGPSQAGKSYLVSVLGKSQGEPLIADFAGTPKNFIQELNPEGGKEATGLVTRFTIVKGTRDGKHSVELRLLTETDLVKIIGNSFMSDFDQNNRKLALPAEDDIRALLAKLEANARASAPHLDEIVMFDIGEYFRANFAAAIGPLVRSGYWDALTRFGHRLALAQRAELYSVLWGQSKDLTDVFLLLARMLEELGHAATGRATLDCLIPRSQSIIDVDVVKLRLGTPEDLKDVISVIPELAEGGDAPPVKVPRATLTALVAEIKVVMASQPWAFFEHTDLLDFPGARAREKMLELPADAQERAFCVRNMLLRGKIAYLFQRYTEERELTSMLLCMPPSNQEVKDLTSLVGKWVGQTHGDSAKDRGKLPCALFFVLTKFDLELMAKPGDTEESWRNRIDTRLEASMYQLYKQEDWLQNWNGKPFASTYFLRNPDYEIEAVFQYGPGEPGSRRETGIASQAQARITANREGFIGSERGRRHFTDPALAWDCAMALNDGGVKYLVDNLEQVLSPTLKARQLAGRLVDQSQQLDSRMRRFYQADDDSSRKEKEGALMNLRRQLHAASKERDFVNFMQLLSQMKVVEADVRGAFLNIASMKIEAQSVPHPAAAAASVAEPDPWDDDPWAEPATAPGAGSTPAPAPRRQRDRFDHFAAQVLNLWTEKVRGLTTQPQTLTSLGMDAQLVGDLGNELVIAAHRTLLSERIADRVRNQVEAANLRWDEVADRSAGIAFLMVNDYVSHLGFGELAPDKRPAVPEAPKPRVRGVFAPLPMPQPGQIPTLSEARVPMENGYFLDWGVAFKQLGLDNVSFSGGREIDEADNRALGAILAEMAPALQVKVD
ncbi:virulence factor SrfC family protein [Variovorax rhizosphaerae]|uniref:Virulence factor SrfC family protein n=1 Tax=Variovorax rhizosphaerae TaxID=1836200 RepID=A0ABU8WR39_9BURK